MKKGLLFIIIAILTFACEEPKKDEEPIKVEENSVLIINEGNMGYGNASVDVYNPSTGTVGSSVFFKNNMRPVGDVLQSVALFDGKVYLVVNNSSKIEVVDSDNFTFLGSIQNLSSPRYFLPINIHKAYVSDFKAEEIHVVDPQGFNKINSIPAEGWIEKMTMAKGKVFACNAISDEVWVIDALNDSVVNKIPVGIEPLEIVSDKNEDVWVLCTGGFEEDFAQLFKIDAASENITKSFDFPSIKSYPQRLKIDGAGENLFYLDQDLYKMSIDANSLPTAAFIQSSGRLLYGLGIDPNNTHIYLTDAIDYLQKGNVFEYDGNGNLIHSFKAGIIPSDFGFLNR